MNINSVISTLQKHNGITHLVFSLPGDAVISKNTVSKINAMPFLLPVEIIEKSAGYNVAFSTDSLISITKYLKRDDSDLSMVLMVLRGICNVVQAVRDSALYTDNLSYCPDQIYIDPLTAEIKMLQFPFETEQRCATALRSLLSTLATENASMYTDDDYKEIKEYCNRVDFKMAEFLVLLDDLNRNHRPTKRKKNKRPHGRNSFFSMLFHKKNKQTKRPDTSVGASSVILAAEVRKKNGTELLLPDDDQGEVIAPSETKAIEKVAQRMVRLTISDNNMTSEAEISVFPCVLGRSPTDANIVLQDSGVSRKHAVINAIEGRLFICDLGSRNGLTLNGVKLTPNSNHSIEIGDRVTIGRVELQVTKADGVQG